MSILLLGKKEVIERLKTHPFSKPVVGVAYDRDTAEEYLQEYEVSDVITGFGIEFALAVAAGYPHRRVYAVLEAEEIDAGTYCAALAGGVTIVEKENAAGSIAAALGRPVSSVPAIQSPKKPEGKCVAFTGGKGGTGKTAISVSFAARIARAAGERGADYRVCYVDCDVEGSRTGGMWFGISEAPQSITLWAKISGRPDWSELDRLLVRHEKSGLWVLPGPQSFHEAINTPVDAAMTEKIISSLRWHFDLVVLDLGSFFKNDAAVKAMQMADRVYLVFEPTAPVLKLMEQVRRENILGKLGVDLARVSLVVNHRTRHVAGVSAADAEAAFGLPVAAVVPPDGIVPAAESSGRGLPPTLMSPGSPFSLAVSRVCREVAGDMVEERKLPLLARWVEKLKRKGMDLENIFART